MPSSNVRSLLDAILVELGRQWSSLRRRWRSRSRTTTCTSRKKVAMFAIHMDNISQNTSARAGTTPCRPAPFVETRQSGARGQSACMLLFSLNSVTSRLKHRARCSILRCHQQDGQLHTVRFLILPVSCPRPMPQNLHILRLRHRERIDPQSQINDTACMEMLLFDNPKPIQDPWSHVAPRLHEITLERIPIAQVMPRIMITCHHLHGQQ